jgi:hypothetical protein
MRVRTSVLFCTLFASSLGWAQHEGHQQAPAPAPQTQQQPPEKPPEKMKEEPAGHAGMQVEQHASGQHKEEVLGSGTMPKPASSPEHMWMFKAGDWQIMAHGNLFLTYNRQGGPRGVGKFESMNWLMLMEHRKLGAGTLVFRQMLSAEPLTAPHGGFPQIFQTGETYKGQPLVDKQHPHDLFGEFSVMYTLPLTKQVGWQFYGAPVGEPALGPVAFMHRTSAGELPAAPLGHHLQDSTHIAAGVVTSGLLFNTGKAGRFKVEGSVFNGREPDENRHTIDFAPLESWAVRGSYEPAANWSMQYSYGYLTQPEALEDTDVIRQTASVTYNRPFTAGNWATSLVWGRNHKLEETTVQNSYLLESTVNFMRRNYAYTRLELVDKDELFPLSPPPHESFRIGAYTFGGVRDFVQNDKVQIGVGADVTVYSKPAALDPLYGKQPLGIRVFLRFRPGLMKH